MADTVRRTLEEMVPELEDLERRGYFDKAEIRHIVQRRENFEYALRRRAALKADFLRYIDFETSLERLRQLRRKQRAISGAPTLADYCIIRRTHYIFERATRKFRGDLSLWSRWLRFCQSSGSSRHMSRVLTRALQLHPTCPALWAYAASWEFEHNGNAVAARALMQRGLRMCKHAHELWHEYFKMELLYAARLVARRQVLGIGFADESAGDKVPLDDGMEVDGDAAAVETVLKGAVALVVYRNAVATVSDSLPFRAGFLEALKPIELPSKGEVQAYILDDIARAFKGTPEVVGMQTRRALEASCDQGQPPTADAVLAAFSVFEEALAAEPSQEQLWDSAIAFLEEQIKIALQADDAVCAVALTKKCMDVMNRALTSHQASDYVLLAAPKLQLRLGDVAQSAAVAELGATAVPRQPPTARRQRLDFRSINAMNGVKNAELLIEALRCTDDSRRPELWLCALRAAVGSGCALTQFGELLIDQQRGSGRGPVRGGMGIPAAGLLSALWTIAGASAARTLYRKLFALPLPGGEVIHAILDCELALLEASRFPSDGHVGALAAKADDALSTSGLRDVFEAGVTAYGEEDEDLWLRYLRFEQEFGAGHGAGAGKIHWRAVKALRNPDVFVARCQLAVAGLG